MMNKWYSLVQSKATPKTAELLIYGDIGELFWGKESVTAKSLISELQALGDVADITLRLNSYGGSVSDAMAIVSALRRHPATIRATIDGVAMSAASMILMAADHIGMPENAMMMIHGPQAGAYGFSSDLRNAADALDRFALAVGSTYAVKTKKTIQEIMEYLSDATDHYFNAQDALDFRLIDEIIEPLAIAASIPARYRPMSISGQLRNPIMTTEVLPNTTAPEPAIVAIAATTPLIDADQVAKDVLLTEQQRRKTIRDSITPKLRSLPGVQMVLDECLDNPEITPDTARHRILTLIGSQSDPLGSHISAGVDSRDNWIEGASQALLMRAGRIPNDPRNEFRSMRMIAIAEESLRKIGTNPRTAGSELTLVKMAITHTTSDFPVILENVLNKTLQASYAAAPATWRRWCSVGSVTDFRPYKRLRLGSFGNLDTLTEGGEYKHKVIPDATAESVSITTKGNTITLSRQAIINDDVGGFTRMSDMLARAAARSIEYDAYILLISNPALDSDSTALFHANHGNLATGGSATAISMTSLDVARSAIKVQKDRTATEYLLIQEPFILLCPVAKAGLARTANESEYDPDTANKLQRVNISRGILSDIIDSPYLTGTAWYMLASSTTYPTFEVLFLNGEETPFSEQIEKTNVDGMVWLIRLDYGVNVVDYVGAYKNDGA